MISRAFSTSASNSVLRKWTRSVRISQVFLFITTKSALSSPAQPMYICTCAAYSGEVSQMPLSLKSLNLDADALLISRMWGLLVTPSMMPSQWPRRRPFRSSKLRWRSVMR